MKPDSKTGGIAVHEIPMPDLQLGGILVKTHFWGVNSGAGRANVKTGSHEGY